MCRAILLQYYARNPSGPNTKPGPRHMTALGKRFAAALEAARAARAANIPASAPASTSATPAEAPPLNSRRMVVALMFGQTPAEVDTALLALRKIAAENDHGIVIVTDRQDIEIFQHPDCIAEYLPAIDRLASLPNPHDPYLYLQDRLAILLRKWEPVQVLPFGDRSVDMFAAFQAAQPRA